MGCVKITSLATYAFNAIMPLSRASTCGRYSRIEGVTRFDWFGLYPLSEFIHNDQQMLSLMASSFKGSDHIESPDRKRPSDGDCL